MNTPLLVAQGLSCAVAERVLFDGLSFAVADGELVEVRGANGSGKSTLLRCLAGLLAPRRGRVQRRCGIDYVGHKSGLCERLTAVENLRWLADVRGDAAESAAGERTDPETALRRVALAGAAHDWCGALSAGQLRRTALARLPLGTARVWLLDEPLTALDDAGAQVLGALIAAHRLRGGAVVCATHRALRAPEADERNAPCLPATRIVRLGP